MAKFFVIGGGEIGTGETAELDRAFVALSGKRKPHALFVATASRDAEPYYETFKKTYEKLGCTTSPLYLTKQSKREAAVLLRSADLVYVGGGNTLYLMRIWRKTGFDKLLKRIANRDIVLGGISAGAICWFDGGFGDAVRKNGKMRMVGSKGLGFLPGICCPHYDDGAVRKTFNAFLAKKNKTGVALENCTAIAVDGERSVIYAKKGKGVYSVCGSKAARLT